MPEPKPTDEGEDQGILTVVTLKLGQREFKGYGINPPDSVQHLENELLGFGITVKGSQFAQFARPLPQGRDQPFQQSKCWRRERRDWSSGRLLQLASPRKVTEGAILTGLRSVERAVRTDLSVLDRGGLVRLPVF